MRFYRLSMIFAIGSVASFGATDAQADDKARSGDSKIQSAKEIDPYTNVSLLDGLRSGTIEAKAVGTGDGRMNLTIRNKSGRRLRVVLPPGLIASGASGQFGGMGGGMGGMGGGGMGGGMGGGSTVMMPTMGLMEVANMFMRLTGDMDSWDYTSVFSSMFMGGGMMGGGMRSVPPSGLPYATLSPDQTRTLPTPLVGIGQSTTGFPTKGESLEIGDATKADLSKPIQNALTRLSVMKAPTVVSQMVMWNLSAGLSWEEIARRAKGTATADDFALAQDLAARLQKEDSLKEWETGRIHWEVSSGGKDDVLADALGGWFKERQMLGLVLQPGVPSAPERPSLAVRVQLHGKDQATVVVQASDGKTQAWANQGKFNLPTKRKAGESDEVYAARISDEIADGVLSRVVRVQVTDSTVDGRKVYKLRVDNASPLVLAGVSLKSPAQGKEVATILNLSVRPHKSVQIPLDAKSVSRFGLAARGVKAMGADLTAL